MVDTWLTVKHLTLIKRRKEETKVLRLREHKIIVVSGVVRRSMLLASRKSVERWCAKVQIFSIDNIVHVHFCIVSYRYRLPRPTGDQSYEENNQKTKTMISRFTLCQQNISNVTFFPLFFSLH